MSYDLVHPCDACEIYHVSNRPMKAPHRGELPDEDGWFCANCVPGDNDVAREQVRAARLRKQKAEAWDSEDV